jgi:hypothetical protein
MVNQKTLRFLRDSIILLIGFFGLILWVLGCSSPPTKKPKKDFIRILPVEFKK